MYQLELVLFSVFTFFDLTMEHIIIKQLIKLSIMVKCVNFIMILTKLESPLAFIDEDRFLLHHQKIVVQQIVGTDSSIKEKKYDKVPF